MTTADGRAHTTDGDRERAQVALGLGGLSNDYLSGHEIDQVNAVADALAAERRRAAEDGQRLRERVEALAAHYDNVLAERGPDTADRLRAALRDDTGTQP